MAVQKNIRNYPARSQKDADFMWKKRRDNFVKGILKNKFFREQLLKTFNGMCADCLKDISPDPLLPKELWDVHHTSYKHACHFVEIQCETCYTQHSHKFLACLSRILPLCRSCHMKRHRRKIARKQYHKPSKKSGRKK